MDPRRLTRSDLIALSRKYRMIAELRRGNDPWPVELSALTREFPGALRELDLLGLDEIERRLEALERAVTSGRVESWMAWMHAYHQSMRAAIALRRRLAGRQRLARALARELAEEASRDTGLGCAPELVLGIASESGATLHVIVLECLAREIGTSPLALKRVLFPEARVIDTFWARI